MTAFEARALQAAFPPSRYLRHVRQPMAEKGHGPSSPSTETMVGNGSIVAVWERRGERRLLAGTEEKIHLSRQIVGLLERSQPSRALHKTAAVGEVLPILDVSRGVHPGKANPEQTVLDNS